ncbi:MAG: hypothetical protein B0D92_00630 [Spirochaeta sp. LUC14_002_19_P3]|nr:MAG: hypothetical protein B0D92_00630 [Spirochaeta sp. LUC14_002_19_P3]
MNSESFTVHLPSDGAMRADKYIANLGLFSRSQIARRAVKVRGASGEEIKLSRRLLNGEDITVEWEDAPAADIEPEAMELDILYEDDDCLVINKAQGIVVHPALGNNHGTLVQGLLHRYASLSDTFDGDRVRPGIVHRLDKDTSGLIIAAKHPRALECLSKEFYNRQVKKTYLAITRGLPPEPAGEILSPIGRDPADRKKFRTDTRNAKDALTRYRIISHTSTHALLQVRILTGRTHQIRVHLKSLHAPVLGDLLYNKKDPSLPDASLMLHAWKLSILLPSGRKMGFCAEIPKRFFEAGKVLGLRF